MDGSMMNEKFYLKGLDGKALCTSGDEIEIGLDNRAWVRKEASERATDISPITGSYIVDGYENNKNDWHYVDITETDAENGVYQWKNKAGITWTLTKKAGSDDKYKVGTDCPYHEMANYKEARLIKGDDGRVKWITGPWGELYKKSYENVEDNHSGDTTFKPNYLGGTLRYVVNVSKVGCNCAAGIFLVGLDGDKCNMGEYEGDSPPDCPTIDVMKAN